MFQSILVPLDGSPWSEHALPVACSIARRSGATLHVVHVHVPVLATVIEGVPIIDHERDVQQRAADQAYLAAIREGVSAACGPTQVALLDGPVTLALNTHCATSAADLLVLTTHGRGGVARAWLGSVADVLLREVAIPLLLIKPHAAEVDLVQNSAFRHILIPLDGSALAEAAIAPALKLAPDATFTLVQIVAPGITGMQVPHLPVSSAEQTWTDQRRVAATTYLQQVAERMRAAGAQAHADVVIASRAATSVLDYASTHTVDLISIATHGRGGLRRMLLGSVADKIVRGANLPVLLYRPGAQADHPAA